MGGKGGSEGREEERQFWGPARPLTGHEIDNRRRKSEYRWTRLKQKSLVWGEFYGWHGVSARYTRACRAPALRLLCFDWPLYRLRQRDALRTAMPMEYALWRRENGRRQGKLKFARLQQNWNCVKRIIVSTHLRGVSHKIKRCLSTVGSVTRSK